VHLLEDEACARAQLGRRRGRGQRAERHVACAECNERLAGEMRQRRVGAGEQRHDRIGLVARTEAYEILARNKQLYTKPVNEKFAIDIVPTGEQLIYASRIGTPRIALIGPTPKLQMPIVFTAMNGRLMIASDIGGGVGGKTVTIFFRPPMPASGPRVSTRSCRRHSWRRCAGRWSRTSCSTR